VLTAKVSLGLDKKKLVDLDAITDVLDSSEAADRAQQVADKAVTLLRNDRAVLPLTFGSRSCLMVVTERRNSPLGQRMMQEFQRRAPTGRVLAVESSLPLAALEASLGDTSTCASIASHRSRGCRPICAT
jgi:beta-glucosidase-like glycosyl hydrolase